MRKEIIAQFGDLEVNKPVGALVENVDLVITRYGESEEQAACSRYFYELATCRGPRCRGRSRRCVD